VELRGTTPMSAQIRRTPHPNLLPMLINVSKLKIVSNPVSLKILPMFFHLQEATLSTPTLAGCETTSLLKIVSKDSMASTSVGEGSNLTNYREVTLATSRHEERKKDLSS
jgi:hypothetical protein